jgi:hypothetical protein
MSSTSATTQDQPSEANAPLFSGLGEWVESHIAICLCSLLATYICAELGYSLRIPLRHDEIFTWYIAQAPSAGSLLHLTRTVDLNPPLSYLLTRLTFQVLGVGTLQTRLPEMLGFGLALVCAFIFVRRRAGDAFGLLAAVILLSGKASEPAIYGRPYGLMLGFAGLALVAWQSSTLAQDRGASTPGKDLLLGLSLAALLLTHVFGMFTWAAISVAEVIHAVQSRRVVRSRILSLALPLTAAVFYVPIFRLHTAGLFPSAFQAHYSQVFVYYASRTSRELISIVCTISILFMVAGRQWLRPSARFAFTRSEWVAVTIVLLSPIILICRLAYEHAAIFYRYGDFAAIGFAILITGLLCKLTGNRSTPAVIATIAFLLVSSRLQYAVIFAAQGHIFRHSEPAVTSLHSRILDASNLPLVINSGLIFAEMNKYEPALLLDRTYYLTGGPIAVQYAHANLFEGVPTEIVEFHFRGHSEPYTAFVQEHPLFFLLAGDHDFPEEWLLRKLQADGAQIQALEHIEHSYSYGEYNLYKVSMPGAGN